MKKSPIGRLATIFVLPVLLALAFWAAGQASGLRPSSFESPIVTPIIPSPTPMPSMPPETEEVLKHIAAREGIPIKQLVVVNQHRREYALLGKSFWAVTALDTKGGGWHNAMMDLGDGSFVDDVAAVERAEREAHRVKYGKLEPALFERLQTMKPDDTATVAIWLAGTPRRSTEELYAALAAKYPEAEAALQRSGKPFDVGDHQLGNELEAEYVKMVEQDTLVKTQSLKDILQAQGYTVKTFGALPVIAATLPKAVIRGLVLRADVGAVYLAEDRAKPQLDSAVPSDRVPIVWQRGFKGSGVDIAILEPGKVDFTGPVGHNYLHQGQVRSPCSAAEDWHKTLVASVAASYYSPYTGVAPEATIDDACTDGTSLDIIGGLSWAASSPSVDVINASFSFTDTGQMQWYDKAFDYWAWYGNDTVVVAAGNTITVASPGLGWNVVTVGGSDDKDTAIWADDTIAILPDGGAAWKNPIGTSREKPEVAAPAASINVIGLNNVVSASLSGTSLAAPQVTGLAALLISRNSSLSIWPEAVKAIIMASAVHNVDGPSDIPAGQDLKDGAGVIDAALADTTASNGITDFYNVTPCNGSCWWAFGINNTNFPVGTYLNRYFEASRGERIRVAISWWSNVNCASQSTCDHDRLDTDLQLGAFAPDGSLVPGAWSASWDNSFELVDFTAPQTGQYTIGVYKYSASETSNFLGIAWVKDATYLPDLRNKDGWVSRLYMRNDNSGGERLAWATYFNTTGSFVGGDACYLFPLQRCSPQVSIPTGTTASSIVNGGEDASVVVNEESGDELSAYSGIVTSDGSSPSGWQVGTTLYAPIIKNAYGGRSSRIYVASVSPVATSFRVQLYDASTGSAVGSARQYVLAPNGSREFLPSFCPSLCSAQIWSPDARPLAVAIMERNDSDLKSRTFHNAFNSGAMLNFVPIVKKNVGNQSTSLTVHNVSTTTATYVYVTCYDSSTAYSCGSQSVPPKATAVFVMNGSGGSSLPEGFVGSAVVNSLNQPVATLIYETGNPYPYRLATNAPLSGSTVAYAPEVYGNYGTQAWNSGIQVQNTSSSASANITVTYYLPDGSVVGSPWYNTVGPYRMWLLNVPSGNLPSNFNGSAVIQSNQPIAVVVNMNHSGSGDTKASYTVPNR